jgi:hypothetical protein
MKDNSTGTVLAEAKKYATGGLITGTGTGTSDSIPAMLSNREYVVKASAVKKYGTRLLDSINNKTFNVPRASNIPTSAMNNNNSEFINSPVYNIVVNAETNADPNEIARVIMKTISADTRTLSVARRIGAVG